MSLTQELPLREKAADAQSGPVEFGHKLRDEQFLFDPSYRNLNHGTSKFCESNSQVLTRPQAPSARSLAPSKPNSARTKTAPKPRRTLSSATSTPSSWTNPAPPSQSS